jgi:hypothetical protein
MRVGIGVTQLGQFAEPTITREIAVLIGTAARFGRDTSTLRLVLRSSPTFSEVALGSDRPPFTGTAQQVADDVWRARDHGVHELILDLQSTSRTATGLAADLLVPAVI